MQCLWIVAMCKLLGELGGSWVWVCSSKLCSPAVLVCECLRAGVTAVPLCLQRATSWRTWTAASWRCGSRTPRAWSALQAPCAAAPPDWRTSWRGRWTATSLELTRTASWGMCSTSPGLVRLRASPTPPSHTALVVNPVAHWWRSPSQGSLLLLASSWVRMRPGHSKVSFIIFFELHELCKVTWVTGDSYWGL